MLVGSLDKCYEPGGGNLEHGLLQTEILQALGRTSGGHPKWRPGQHWARGEEREGSTKWGMGAAGLGRRRERVGLNRDREDVNQAVF